MSEELNQRPKRLTARIKFQLYLETRNPDANIGEILRRYGLHLADLRKIEEAVENGALSALKVGFGRHAKKLNVTPEEYERLATELREKEKALADLAAEYQLFKKKERLDYPGGRNGKSSRPRRGR